MKQWPEKQSEIHIGTVLKGSTFTTAQTCTWHDSQHGL